MEINQIYQLSNTSIDEISEKTAAFLESLNMEAKNILRLRLMVEDILLEWQNRFSPEMPCRIRAGKRMGRPFLHMEVAGEAFNPLDSNVEEFGEYRTRLLANMGLSPLYSYEGGKNRIIFKLKRAPRNPLVSLAAAVVCGALVGTIGQWLPDAVRLILLNSVLTPIYDTFFNLLGTIAGPMVFLSVAWGIYGIGDTATFGRIGKRMILHFIGGVFLFCVAAVLLAMPFFSLNLVVDGGGISELDTLFRMILGFIPADIITPFQSGNSLQIILMGAAVGMALLVLGKQTEIVAQAIEQINYLVQFLMEVINSLVPCFVFIVLVQMIWSDTLNVVLSAWKPLVIFVAVIFVIAAAQLLYVSLRCGVSPVRLMKKNLPTFLIAVSTASSVASFGNCVSTCEKKMGISENITSFGIPLGMVMFPPATAIYFILICIHTAEAYGVECSLVWFVLAIFSAAVLAIASPPIPGGTLTCYTIMFSQLGLPEEAIVVALALDVLCDFLATGMNMMCLQNELVLQAGNMNMLDVNCLRDSD